MRLLSAIVLGLSLWGLACAGTRPVVVVPPKQATFAVALPANPTTGYQWTVVAYDKTKLVLLGQKYQSKRLKLIGGGGEMFFYFKCRALNHMPRHMTLQFVYKRPWEKQAVKPTAVEVVFEK